MQQRKTAGELSQKALADTTKYDALEVGHAIVEDVEKHIRDCIEKHRPIIDEPEFCVIRIIADDPLIKNVRRAKWYAWPYLPKPRPNQAVLLYNKALDRITKRLWILPSDMVMAELSSLSVVDKRYQTMKFWSDLYFEKWKYIDGNFVNTDPCHFWKVIRAHSKIDMPSEHEYFLEHREELIQAGCKIPNSDDTEAFDFRKIHIKHIIDTQTAVSE
jgi:hypothetical protein